MTREQRGSGHLAQVQIPACPQGQQSCLSMLSATQVAEWTAVRVMGSPAQAPEGPNQKTEAADVDSGQDSSPIQAVSQMIGEGSCGYLDKVVWVLDDGYE